MTGKEIATKMKKHQLLKGFASAVAKMDTVTEKELNHKLQDYVPGKMIADLFKESKLETISDLQKLVTERVDTIMAEMKVSHKYKIGNFQIELTKDNQIDFKKGGKLVKTVDVSPSYDQRDLSKLAAKLAKKEKTTAEPIH